jgi:hypothetical protein
MLTTPSCQIWLPFEGNGNDFSGKGRNGSAVGTPTYAAGVVGRCVALNGTTQRFDMGNTLASTDSMSCAAWFRRSGTGAFADGSIRAIGGKRINSNATSSWWWALSDTTNFYLALGRTGTVSSCIANVSTLGLQKGTWYHGVWVINSTSGNNRFYLNGVLASTSGAGGSGTPQDNASWPCRFGAMDGTPAYYWDGNLDDVRIYSRALSADEALTLSARAGSIRG